MYRQHLKIDDRTKVDKDNPSVLDLIPSYDEEISIEGVWDICPNVNFYDLYCYTKDIKEFEYDDVDLVLKQGDRYIADLMLPLRADNPVDYRILNRHPSYSIIILKEQVELFIKVFLEEKNKYINHSPLADQKLLTENEDLRAQLLNQKELLAEAQFSANQQNLVIDSTLSEVKELQLKLDQQQQSESLLDRLPISIHHAISTYFDCWEDLPVDMKIPSSDEVSRYIEKLGIKEKTTIAAVKKVSIADGQSFGGSPKKDQTQPWKEKRFR
jgi:hypothetical protein